MKGINKVILVGTLGGILRSSTRHQVQQFANLSVATVNHGKTRLARNKSKPNGTV